MTRKELEELWERDPRAAIKLEIKIALRRHDVRMLIEEAEQIVNNRRDKNQ